MGRSQLVTVFIFIYCVLSIIIYTPSIEARKITMSEMKDFLLKNSSDLSVSVPPTEEFPNVELSETQRILKSVPSPGMGN